MKLPVNLYIWVTSAEGHRSTSTYNALRGIDIGNGGEWAGWLLQKFKERF